MSYLFQIGCFYLFALGSGLDDLLNVFREDGYLYELFELANATDTFYDLKFVVKVLDGNMYFIFAIFIVM